MAAENDTLYCQESGNTFSGVDDAEGDECPEPQCPGVLVELDEDVETLEDDSDLDMRSCNETRLPCGCILVLPGPDDAPEDVAAIQWCSTHAAAQHWRTALTAISEMTRHDGARAAGVARAALAWPGTAS